LTIAYPYRVSYGAGFSTVEDGQFRNYTHATCNIWSHLDQGCCN
jgi:hypothetical protein